MGSLRILRQEKFVREYVKTGSLTEAYRKYYPNAKKFNCVAAGAHNLAVLPHVKARIQELRDQMARKSDITMEKILTDYQDALNMAKQDGKPNEMISAAREQAKLVGLLVERKEVGNAGDFDSMENISDILQAVNDKAGPEAALALSKVFNLVGEREVIVGIEQTSSAATDEAAEALFMAKPASEQVN